MKSPTTKFLLFVFGSIAAGAVALVLTLLVLFGVSLARTQSDILVKTAPSPDGKLVVSIYDHHPGGDLTPSVNISIKSAAPNSFFHPGNQFSSVIFSKQHGCSLDSAFDARWVSASALTITYPEPSPGPYCRPGDDPVLIKETQWVNITINYQIAGSVSLNKQ
jgi:hypothetical protein